MDLTLARTTATDCSHHDHHGEDSSTHVNVSPEKPP
jgi:hypothetical protein